MPRIAQVVKTAVKVNTALAALDADTAKITDRVLKPYIGQPITVTRQDGKSVNGVLAVFAVTVVEGTKNTKSIVYKVLTGKRGKPYTFLAEDVATLNLFATPTGRSKMVNVSPVYKAARVKGRIVFA